MKKYLGVFFVSLPFVAILTYMVVYNWKAFFITLSLVLIALLCIKIGISLLEAE